MLKDEGHNPAVVFLDLSAAFDTVNHQILLKKYQLSGIGEEALILLNSYLSDRRQFTEVNGVSSEEVRVSMGTPQGSCLSTLNYTVYVNDIARLTTSGRLRMFADDKAMIYDDYDEEVIQADMTLVAEYFRINKLTVNFNKSKIVVFGSRSHAVSALSFNGTEIEAVSDIKYLGLNIDQGLTWRTHINELCSSISSAIGILYKVRSFFPSSALKMAYNSLVQSKMLYMIQIYGTATKTLLNRVFVLQKRALKLIHGVNLRHSTVDLFSNVAKNQLPLGALITRSIALHVHKLITNQSFHNLQLPRVPNDISTRSSVRGSLKVRRSRTSRHGDACMRSIGPKIYNELPRNVIEIISIPGFKRATTNYLQQPDCLAKAISLSRP